MLKIKGFITNLGKYNEGELIGEWITFPIDEEELNEVFERIGMNYDDENGSHIDRGYEEYFFTDWETEFENDFGEYVKIRDINEIAEKLEDWDENVFLAACEYVGLKEVLETTPYDWLLIPGVENDYDLGYYWVEESGCYNTESLGNLKHYIDYESFGRDIRLDIDGAYTDYGFIQRL